MYHVTHCGTAGGQTWRAHEPGQESQHQESGIAIGQGSRDTKNDKESEGDDIGNIAPKNRQFGDG